MMKKLACVIAVAVSALGQSPQSTAPISSVNARYEQGIARGFWPTNGGGLNLHVASGTCFTAYGVRVALTASTQALTASTTNYVYLDSTCTATVALTSYPTGTIPIAKVVTGPSTIASITDDRTQAKAAVLPSFFPDEFPGVTCGGSDEHAAIDSMLSTIYALGGGNIWSRPGQFCRHTGSFTWPTGSPSTAQIYWHGCGPEGSGEWGTFPSASCAFTVTGSDALGLIKMTGIQSGGFVDMAIRDDADCNTIMWVTGTTVHLGHTSFVGWKARPDACNIAIQFGDTTCHGTPSHCYTGYRSDGEIYAENISQILVGGGDFATNHFGLWGSSTDSNMSGGVPVGPFVTLDGGNASNEAIQNYLEIYAELGNAASHTGASAYTSVVAEDYAGPNTIQIMMADDDASTPEPTAVFTWTANTQNGELHCNYYHYLNFPCVNVSSWAYNNTIYDPQRGKIMVSELDANQIGATDYMATGESPNNRFYNDGGITSVGAPTLAGTGACATRSSRAGGAWAGEIECTGTTGASTLTITPGTTALHGWTCWGSDTTTGVIGVQTTRSATAPVLSFAAVITNDVITFGCLAY